MRGAILFRVLVDGPLVRAGAIVEGIQPQHRWYAYVDAGGHCAIGVRILDEADIPEGAPRTVHPRGGWVGAAIGVDELEPITAPARAMWEIAVEGRDEDFFEVRP